MAASGHDPSPVEAAAAASGHAATAAPAVPSDGIDHALHPSPPILPAPSGGVADARAAIIRLAGTLGPALGNAYLVPRPWIGMLLWASFLWAPRHAAFGLLGLAVAMAGQRLLGISEELRVGGGLRANALMSAVAAGWMTGATNYPLQVQIAIAVAVAAASFVITATIMRVLRKSDFPSLLWGYSLAASGLFALFPIGTTLAVKRFAWSASPQGVVDWIAAFFHSLGVLMFAPSLEVGILVGCAVLLWSRTAFAAGLVGWVAGAAVAIGIQDLGVPYLWLPAAYNYFIAGMAVGAYFILPGYSSLLFAALAGIGASLCAVALQVMLPALAYLPTSSALAIWVSVATLALAGTTRGFWSNSNPRLPPEESWWRENLWYRRVGRQEPLLIVPITGTVEVGQGFEGALSHKAGLRHALDFMRHGGAQPTTDADFSIVNSLWNSAVFAPAAGLVERVRNDVADNPLGICNYAESWGNYVCIRLDQGGWALLAHLRQGSVVVKPGARVELGAYLGTAGNSGRSPVPHLHLQVQNGPEPGARTLPFRLANYYSAPSPGQPLLEWNAARIPEQGTYVAAAAADPAVHTTLASLAPGIAIWSVEQQGKLPRAFHEREGDATLQIGVAVDEWGWHRLSSARSSLVCVLAPDAWRSIEQRGTMPFLRLLALGAPSIPYAVQAGVSWSDIAPLVPIGARGWATLALAPYRMLPFTHTHSICTAAPTAQSSTLAIETVVAPRHASLPSKIDCTFDRLRGPISVEATFDHGSVRYSIVSFTPGMPLAQDRRRGSLRPRWL